MRYLLTGLRRAHVDIFSRKLSSFCHLSDRAVIRVQGPESAAFLQGLITNDISQLTTDSDLETNKKCIYTMMLNNQGRILFDGLLFLGRVPDEFWFDCHQESASKIMKHMKMFRVRRKADIELMKSAKVVSVFNTTPEAAGENLESQLIGNVHCNKGQELTTSRGDESSSFNFRGILVSANDPRCLQLGCRMLFDGDMDSSNLSVPNLEAGMSETYVQRRYSLGISEGPHELPMAKCFPLEYNADYMHGVSFHKGCYLGQELTARTHHTGVVRKRILPLTAVQPGESAIDFDADILNGNGRKVGKVRGQNGTQVLALMRLAETFESPNGGLFCKDWIFAAKRPEWWPILKEEK